MVIQINNWDKYQIRKDLQSMTWFRLESNIIFDPNMYSMSYESKWLFVTILCIAAMFNSGEIDIELSYAAFASGIPEKHIASLLEILQQKQLVRLSARDQHDVVPKACLQTNKQTNKQTADVHDYLSDVKTIIDYLNLRLQKKEGACFRYNSKKTVQLITARINDGFNISDFKSVIDKKIKQWSTDIKMSQYLRPSTLFNEEKFENYLNEVDPQKIADENLIKSLGGIIDES